MKAQTFLEWFISQGNRPTFYVGEEGNLFYQKHYKKVADFYSQPFKPEMITEYFEGFKMFDNAWCIGNKSVSEEGIVIGMRVPLTLDMFISDCNRAGIELTWKPEIVKEYFK